VPARLGRGRRGRAGVGRGDPGVVVGRGPDRVPGRWEPGLSGRAWRAVRGLQPLSGPLPCRTSVLRRPEPPALCPPRSSSRLPTPIRSGWEFRGRGSGPQRAAAARLAFLSSLAFLSYLTLPPPFYVPGFCFLLLFYALGVLFLSPSSWVYIIMLLFCRATRRPWRLKKRWNAFRSSLNIIK
jgi:hypothetical protein